MQDARFQVDGAPQFYTPENNAHYNAQCSPSVLSTIEFTPPKCEYLPLFANLRTELTEHTHAGECGT